jgi:hypothetical protein
MTQLDALTALNGIGAVLALAVGVALAARWMWGQWR